MAFGRNFYNNLCNNITSGDIELVRLDIEAIKQPLNYGLVRAAMECQIDMVKAFLDAGADVNATDENNRTALFWAANRCDIGIVELLISRGADANVIDVGGDTALKWAAYNHSSELVRDLLAAGALTDPTDQHGTALGVAACKNCIDIVVDLIKAGANVNAVNRAVSNTTVLLSAASFGEAHTPDIINLLIEAGANVNAKNDHDITALMCASGAGRTDNVIILLAKGANVDDINTFGQTALMLAVLNNHPATVGVLLEAGANINATIPHGSTVLSLAVGMCRININIVKMLLADPKIDLGIECDNVDAALHITKDRTDPAIYDLIIEARAAKMTQRAYDIVNGRPKTSPSFFALAAVSDKQIVNNEASAANSFNQQK